MARCSPNNYQVSAASQQDTNTFNVKLDQKLGAADHLSCRYSWQHATTLQQSTLGLASGPSSSGGIGTNRIDNTAAEHIHLFSPTLFTDVRVGINLYRNNVEQATTAPMHPPARASPASTSVPSPAGSAQTEIPLVTAPLHRKTWIPASRLRRQRPFRLTASSRTHRLRRSGSRRTRSTKGPTILSYNLTVEGDLGHSWVGNAAYAGNLERQIPAYYKLNAGLIAGAGAAGRSMLPLGGPW